jgi:hypothetical protein
LNRFCLLLDELQVWNKRAEFDIYRNHVTGTTTPHRRHLYDRSINVNHRFSCIFCQTLHHLTSVLSRFRFSGGRIEIY